MHIAAHGATAPSRSRSICALSRRTLDGSIALLLLLILLPLMLVTAALIQWETPGPALFRQRRCGQGGQEFLIFKFRTMRVLEDGAAVRQATRGDCRVTRFGRVLRRTSLDELPQLLNVLIGDMALVGPRPHAVAHDEYYAQKVPGYSQRYQVKPGMTGWAQINGLRGETSELSQMKRRIEFDLWYIQSQSMLLDIRILAVTPFAILKEAF